MPLLPLTALQNGSQAIKWEGWGQGSVLARAPCAEAPLPPWPHPFSHWGRPALHLLCVPLHHPGTWRCGAGFPRHRAIWRSLPWQQWMSSKWVFAPAQRCGTTSDHLKRRHPGPSVPHHKAQAAAEGARSVQLCHLPLLLPSVCCLSLVCDHAFVHEQGVFGLQHVQGWVGGHCLWHVARESGWPHPQKISANFTKKKWSKTLKFTRYWHKPLVNSQYFKCSSMIMSAWNLTKLQGPMSNTLHHTFQL